MLRKGGEPHFDVVSDFPSNVSLLCHSCELATSPMGTNWYTTYMTPYSTLRNLSSRTRLQIAELSDNTEQYIKKLELGLVNSPDSHVTKILLEEIDDPGTKFILSEILTIVKETGTKYTDLPEQIQEINGLATSLRNHQEHLFNLWFVMEQYAARKSVSLSNNLPSVAEKLQQMWKRDRVKGTPMLLRIFLQEAMEEDNSVKKFCGDFRIHPATWGRWETSYKYGHKKVPVPPTVETAFADAKIVLDRDLFI